MLGRGGTSPECVAQYVVTNKFHGSLILATDGQVRYTAIKLYILAYILLYISRPNLMLYTIVYNYI